MGTPRFAGLDQRMRAAAAMPADDDEEITPADDAEEVEEGAGEKKPKSKKKDSDMTDKTTAEDALVIVKAEELAAPIKVSAPDAAMRLKSVAGDGRVKGKEAHALEMLADEEFDGLSAEAICKIIAKAPAATTNADDEDRAAMRASLEARQNPDLGTSGDKEAVKAEDNPNLLTETMKARTAA